MPKTYNFQVNDGRNIVRLEFDSYEAPGPLSLARAVQLFGERYPELREVSSSSEGEEASEMNPLDKIPPSSMDQKQFTEWREKSERARRR